MYLILITIILAAIISELIKFIAQVIKDKKVAMQNLFSTGGIVSSHSAFVWSLAAIVGLVEGISTAVFAVSFVLAMIVSRDAFGIRRSVDRLAELTGKSKRLGTAGHTLLQTVLGALLGIIIAVAVFYI